MPPATPTPDLFNASDAIVLDGPLTLQEFAAHLAARLGSGYSVTPAEADSSIQVRADSTAGCTVSMRTSGNRTTCFRPAAFVPSWPARWGPAAAEMLVKFVILLPIALVREVDHNMPIVIGLAVLAFLVVPRLGIDGLVRGWMTARARSAVSAAINGLVADSVLNIAGLAPIRRQGED